MDDESYKLAKRIINSWEHDNAESVVRTRLTDAQLTTLAHRLGKELSHLRTELARVERERDEARHAEGAAQDLAQSQNRRCDEMLARIAALESQLESESRKKRIACKTADTLSERLRTANSQLAEAVGLLQHERTRFASPSILDSLDDDDRSGRRRMSILFDDSPTIAELRKIDAAISRLTSQPASGSGKVVE